MIYVDGLKIKTPTAFTWGLMDLTDGDAGRTQDGRMHKSRTGQKRKLTIGWSYPTKEETSMLLKAFNPEYIKVTYPDSLSGVDETREFYVGDRSAPVKMWTVQNKRYEQISFELNER